MTTLPTAERAGHDDHGDNPRLEMGFAIAAGVTYFAGLALEFLTDLPDAAPLSLYLATYFFGGFFTLGSALRAIRRGKFEVDFLMLVAAIGAGAVGKFTEGAVLLFLFSLGHALEEYAMGRAKRSVEALAELAPPVALIKLSSGEVVERPTEDLKPGETILVKPNSRIPADGFVVAGASAVDQSSLTGESMPVEKSPVERSMIDTPSQINDSGRVFAGTINGAGSLDVVVSTSSQDNTLARLVMMVCEADSTKSTTQRSIDRFQRIYVPAVVAAVALVFVLGLLLGSEPVSDSFYRAMLVLVAASPCALAIATPSAVLAGVARAAKAGLLVKGGAALENLGQVDAIAFDKTGTLTWGQPQLTDVIPLTTFDEQDLIRFALAVESASDHPLAGAITRGLADVVPISDRAHAEEVTAVTGFGVQATIDGQVVRIGSAQMFDQTQFPVPASILHTVNRLQTQGRTTMLIHAGDRYLGVLGVMDVPREEAFHVLSALRTGGIDELLMISGDNQQVADFVGAHVGVDSARGDLLPHDKVQVIAELTASGKLTAMVGDGVNDAPAMANATVGVAMGAAGSAVALEAADIALMSDDLGRIPFLIRLSRASSAIIRQNFIAAMLIVAFLIPASLLGLAMGPVVFIHEGSTLLVIANALRLLRFERGREHADIDHEQRPDTGSLLTPNASLR